MSSTRQIPPYAVPATKSKVERLSNIAFDGTGIQRIHAPYAWSHDCTAVRRRVLHTASIRRPSRWSLAALAGSASPSRTHATWATAPARWPTTADPSNVGSHDEAMMLPAVAPVASLYARTSSRHALKRLSLSSPGTSLHGPGRHPCLRAPAPRRRVTGHRHHGCDRFPSSPSSRPGYQLSPSDPLPTPLPITARATTALRHMKGPLRDFKVALHTRATASGAAGRSCPVSSRSAS